MTEDTSPSKIENIRVLIRLRPLNPVEKGPRTTQVNCTDNTLILTKPHTVEDDGGKKFHFSKIFDETSSQMDVYKTTAVPIIEKVLHGYNGTIFAYGQSGTGKTYTMLHGIAPNVFSHIFTTIAHSPPDISYAVTATYLEIYNEKVHDLLASKRRPLKIRERCDLGVYVTDLSGYTVNSLADLNSLLTRGNRARHTDATLLNRNSSRSHAIFTILISTRDFKTNATSFGKLNLVDLAGSERADRTLATGRQLKASCNINASLFVLANVISALIDGKSTHVPYRDSKLTRLLKDSLGGNSMTTMIAMVSAAAKDYEETLFTLLYADRVRHVQNFVKINSDVDRVDVIGRFEMKVAELRRELKELRKVERRRRWNDVERERIVLLERIECIEKKILVGERVREQKSLLNDTAEELAVLESANGALQRALEGKSRERTACRRNYESLRAEDGDLDDRIEMVERLIRDGRGRLLRKECEYQRDIGDLLFLNKCLAREMSLAGLVIRESVPAECIEEIQRNLSYDDEIQKWSIKGVAWAGNNVRVVEEKANNVGGWKGRRDVYFSYNKS